MSNIKIELDLGRDYLAVIKVQFKQSALMGNANVNWRVCVLVCMCVYRRKKRPMTSASIETAGVVVVIAYPVEY